VDTQKTNASAVLCMGGVMERFIHCKYGIDLNMKLYHKHLSSVEEEEE
jgi:hypothetical protein